MTGARTTAGALLHAAALLAVYLATGPARASVLDDTLGPIAASAAEAAAFTAASLVSVALILPRLAGDWPAGRARAVGLGSILVLAVADAAIAVTLCGVPLASHAARFATVPGLIQAAALAFHAAAPALWLAEDPRPAET